ncbi:MAG TPA: NADPH-dependent FMN reductase, partial [Atopostipes sp.]|nr:NADPH-dependent FMN reductase [Atopostipes sp.]
MKKLIGLVGTNSTQSTNRQLLQYMKRHFAKDATID